MTEKEAFNIGLPKWTQMVVNGKKITKEQALNIIKRTDSAFFCMCGNNHDFIANAKEILRKPESEDYKAEDGGLHWNQYREATDEWNKRWGLITELDYLKNGWVSCAWVGGPHGWCHPDGTIAYCNNIGKWPEVEEVYNELSVIAGAFPFLELTCTLMDGEEDYCDSSLCTIQVSGGEVSFIDTIPIEKLTMNGENRTSIDIKNLLSRDYSYENYFPLGQIQKWYDESFK